MSLDDADNDPARFWSYVISALDGLHPRVGARTRELLHSPRPLPAETVLMPLLNDLDAVDEHFVLVLDDYHVITSRAVNEALAYLLDHLPPRMHLVIASRANPPLPLARLRAHGELTELRAADLRFTPGETASFLTDVMQLALSAEDIAVLVARTEGWIAGLRLAALALQGQEDAHGFVRAFGGSHRYIFDYLVEEVLQLQPEHVRSFLLETSILDRLSGSLCDSVTGRRDGQAMLEAFERAHLFVVSLDYERRWYRYHHLFAEVLQSRLGQE